MIFVVFFFVSSFIFPQKTLLEIEENRLYDYDFFHVVPFSEWSSLDSTKKDFYFNGFVEKELVYHHSLKEGFVNFPETYKALYERKKQLLINFYYEREVAGPKISPSFLLETKKNLFDRVYVYHLLLGHNGSSLYNKRSKEESFLLANKIKKQVTDSLVFVDFDNKAPVFSFFAETFSEDPSSKQNKGELGWISWGQVMPSFQKAAFSSSVLSVSGPIETEFGYHLIFVQKRGFSDYYYYNNSLVEGLSYKFGLQNVPLDSLKAAASLFDSLLVSDDVFFVNTPLVNSLLSVVENKTKIENLRGGKNLYIEWFNETKNKEVLFVYKDRAFGVGWFTNQLKNTPSTRVPSIKTKEGFVSLLKSFLLQEAVLALAENKNLSEKPFFKKDFSNHKKNILYKQYEKMVILSLQGPDSSVVKKMYNNGVFSGEHIKPREVVFSEVRFSSKSLADSVYSVFLSSGDFNNILSLYGGDVKKPISFGGGGLLGEVAFSLDVGGVSSVIENPNKSFSIIRVEGFNESEPFSLDRVYTQIERKIKNALKDSAKKNLDVFLIKKYNPLFFKEVLSF